MSAARLAVFIRSLGAGGGAERMMLHLAGAFAARGHAVDLVLGRASGHFLEQVPADVRVVDLGGPRARAATLLLRDPTSVAALAPAVLNTSPPWVLACVPALEAYLRRERPDALLSALNYTNVAALWARRLAGVPCRLVVSERNTLSVRATRETKRRLRVLPGVVRHFYPWADDWLAVSAGVARDLEQVLSLPEGAVTTTYNPVVTPDIAARAAEPAPHPWLDDDVPVLLACGKLKTQKDFPTLLRAFARLRRGRALRLLILGEGPERRRLEALAAELGVAEHVALPGFAGNPFAAMARAAVFVLSSAWEGLPGVLIQALACGAKVVSTDCPSGPGEILEDGRHGLLVPVGDDAALADAIARALDAPAAPDAAKARAADFAVDAVAERYLAALWPAAISRTKDASRSATRS